MQEMNLEFKEDLLENQNEIIFKESHKIPLNQKIHVPGFFKSSLNNDHNTKL